MTAGVRSKIVMVDCAFYRTDCHTSMTLVYHNQHGRPQRKEQNLIVHSSKSEAKITNDRRLCSTYNTTRAKC